MQKSERETFFRQLGKCHKAKSLYLVIGLTLIRHTVLSLVFPISPKSYRNASCRQQISKMIYSLIVRSGKSGISLTSLFSGALLVLDTQTDMKRSDSHGKIKIIRYRYKGKFEVY